MTGEVSTHAQSMAVFQFNFVLPTESEENAEQSTQTSQHTESVYIPNTDPTSSGHTAIGTVSTLSLSPSPLQNDSCLKLSSFEMDIEIFHEHLVNFVTPLQYDVLLPLSQSSPPSLQLCEHVTLYYVTSNQLKTLLDSGESDEQDLNLKSGTESEVITRLGSELGPLVGITDLEHSDLIPGVYEGGMKIWECAYDLIDYLATEQNSIPLCGSRVLELGCGIGLPGIFALLYGAQCVHFHDYNREVLSCLTIPSVLASSISGQPRLRTGQPGLKTRQTSVTETVASQTKFFFGDWADFATSHSKSGEAPYDIILTSETIYSISSQPKLLRALKQLTNQSGGLIVMAAKTHYFGVGGGVAMFQDLLSHDGYFETAIARRIEANVPRLILILKPKPSS